MRLFFSTFLALLLLCSYSNAQGVTKKTLIGKWSIKTVGAGEPSPVKRTIEFKSDGTLIETIGETAVSGKYRLTGSKLSMALKGAEALIVWDKLKLQGGKIIYPITETLRTELTRIK